MNNLVWLADHDKDALLALIACQHHTCDDCSFAKYPACEAQGGYSKWLWAEHVDDNSVRDATNKHAYVDSREKLEEDAWEFVSSAWHAGRNFELGKTPDSWDIDELIALLDRQAAITANELTSKSVDEKQSNQAETNTAKCDIRNSDDYDYWDDCSTCKELDHLQRENINLANDLGKCMAERDEFKRMYDKESNAYKLIKLAYDNAHARAERVTREREELRKHLGAVLDAAQEIRRIGALYGVD